MRSREIISSKKGMKRKKAKKLHEARNKRVKGSVKN